MKWNHERKENIHHGKKRINQARTWERGKGSCRREKKEQGEVPPAKEFYRTIPKGGSRKFVHSGGRRGRPYSAKVLLQRKEAGNNLKNPEKRGQRPQAGGKKGRQRGKIYKKAICPTALKQLSEGFPFHWKKGGGGGEKNKNTIPAWCARKGGNSKSLQNKNGIC